MYDPIVLFYLLFHLIGRFSQDKTLSNFLYKFYFKQLNPLYGCTKNE